MPTASLDADVIAASLARLLPAGQVTELRALNYQRPGSTYSATVSGYFDDYTALAEEAAKLSPHCSGVYFTPNPIKADLLARVCNKAKQMGKGDATTADHDVTRRHWLLIDCDPCRVSGISATDDERGLAFERADSIRDYLSGQGWPDPIRADSGNGAHLMYRIDEPCEDTGLVKACLESLSERFSTDTVHVDTAVFNPARIWKLPGTLARKGENLPERPHRIARLMHCPEPLEIVTTDQLRALAGTGLSTHRTNRTLQKCANTRYADGGFNLESWIAEYLPEASCKRTADGDVWTLETCPFNPDHNRGEAFIIRRGDGTIGAGCKHDSCAWGWKELRAKLEPGCYDRSGQRSNNEHASLRTGEEQGFPLTDLGNAERLIAAHGENLRYDVDAGKWLVWNGKRWEHDATGSVDRLAQKVVRAMYKSLPGMDRSAADALYNHAKRSESKPRLEAMVALAETLEGVPVRAADLDREPLYLNCLNGTIDLRSGKLRPHDREDLMTKLAPVEYDPQAQCPRWLQFLDEVFQDNADIAGFVKRMAGYLLTGDTSEQTAFILTGKGCNGKSTLVETLRGVLGDYAADTPFSTFVERHDSNTADLAGLVGKRLITASEGEDTQSFNESLLKRCTGGDPVTCRHLYREYFEYVPTFKIVFSTNEVPRIHSQNYAMKRRIRLVPFRQRFYEPHDGKTPVKDPQLPAKLLAERNGILAWAVRGCLDWRKRGLDTPAVIRQEGDKLFESQDPLAEFIESVCVIGPGAEVEVGILWQGYNLWCDETGRKPAYKQPQGFSRSLTQRDGIESRKGTGGVRMLSGIGLADDDLGRAWQDKCGTTILADRTYTADGLLSKIANSTGDNIEYTYDGAHRELTCYQAYPNKTVQHVYQQPNNKTLTVNVRNGNGTAGALLGTYTHEYDGDWRPTALTNPKGIKTTYGYDSGTGLLSRVTYNVNALPGGNYPGCPYTLLGYDTTVHKRLWLTSVGNFHSDGSKISTFDYLYDNAGNRTKMTEADGAYTNYAYDSSYQLLSEERKTSGGAQVYKYEYQYDEAGNRTQKKLTNSTPGSPKTYTYAYGDNNLLTNITGATTCSFAYDYLGNQTERNITSSPTSHWYYKYDSDNHLTAIGTTLGGSQIGAFRYDALGRRDGRTDKSRKFVYYENSLIAETDSANNIVAWYTPGVSESRLEGTVWNTYYYHCDAEGTTREVTNSLQQVTDAYAYNAWGEDLGELRAANDPTKPVNPLRYVGKEGYYTDTDTGLMLLGARYYDPLIGRFITQDPAQSGLNWYVYAANNPVNNVDPTGLYSFGLQDFKSDAQGRTILSHWLRGSGHELDFYNDSSWSTYMMNNASLQANVNDVLYAQVRTMQRGEKRSINLSIHMEIENGEGVVGYQYLHGTNKKVGDFQISGTICSHADDGSVAFNMTYQWNDVIDPNLTYESDGAKATIANMLFNPKDYTIRIRWNDRSVMDSKGAWTSGWMATPPPAAATSSGRRGTRR